MFLCLCMAFTLADVALPTAAAAESPPLTDTQITAKVDDYISAVNTWMKDNQTNRVYWNQGRDICNTTVLKGFVDRKDYTGGLNKFPCILNNPKGDHRAANGCKSNSFTGVNSGDTQCAGFADYMEYVIFQTTARWTPEYTVAGDYNFRPGDLVRYNEHSAVVYKIEGDKVYFIECNWRGNNGHDCCIIRWDRSVTQDALRADIKKADGYVIRPPASLRIDGTTPPPSTPTNITGVWKSTGPQWTAEISWDKSEGATYYNVEYRTPKTNNQWKKDPDYSSGNRYISAGLKDYNSYDYRVQAGNAGGKSDWIYYTLKKPDVVTPPAKPENISAT